MPVVITPAGGREPGTRRAARGRSRQPVASTTAAGASERRPAGLVTSSALSADQPVTIALSSMRAPARRAACT